MYSGLLYRALMSMCRIRLMNIVESSRGNVN